jgi:predicted nucleic acid-binding OB-fold protein
MSQCSKAAENILLERNEKPFNLFSDLSKLFAREEGERT